MNAIFSLASAVSAPFLRISLGVVLFWIGALKFADPSPVVGLLGASLPFLATPAFVYLLGAVEVIAAIMLFTNYRAEWAGLISMGLFSGTLLIFLIAPNVVYGEAGFPLLQLPGEFLLKDLVLFAASATVSGQAAARSSTSERHAERMLRRAA